MLYLIGHHSAALELTPEEEWQLLQNAVKHDLSKWKPDQFHPYCNKFVRKVEDDGFEAAWKDHYDSENHHYQGGKWMGKLETIEVCCDLQSMADEFGEGSAFGFYDTKWRPDFHAWLNSEKSEGTEVRRQMADDYQWFSTTGLMESIFKMLNPEKDA